MNDKLKNKLIEAQIKSEQKAREAEEDFKEYEKARDNYNYLTDAKIQANIIESGSMTSLLQNAVFDIPTIWFLGTINYFLLTSPDFLSVNIPMYFKTYLYLIVGFGIICAILEFVNHKKCKEFAIKNYKKTKSFKSKFIKIKKEFDIFSLRTNYFIYFLNDKDIEVKCKIPKKEYKIIKENKLPKNLYVLKYPSALGKIKSKSGYQAYIYERLENVSFLKVKEDNYINSKNNQNKKKKKR